MTDSMKDWPQALKRNAAVIELAYAMYKARAEAYGGPQHLVDEPPSVRNTWITRADEFLKTVQPAPPPAHVAPVRRPELSEYVFNLATSINRSVATGLRGTVRPPVIGAIEPPEDGAA